MSEIETTAALVALVYERLERNVAIAADSFAETRALNKLGIATAEMIDAGTMNVCRSAAGEPAIAAQRTSHDSSKVAT